MRKNPKIKLEDLSPSDKLQEEAQLVMYKHSRKEIADLRKSIKDWTAKILKLTVRIEDQYPELFKSLEEMPVIVPDEKNPALTEIEFKNYYISLNEKLKKYILEYPKHSGYEK